MAIIIKNKINLDIISNGNEEIDNLLLINNLYGTEIRLDIGVINKLEIINLENYVTRIYGSIIDKVVNGGELVLTNVVMNKLDCSRFKRVKLENCNILEIIRGDCEVVYDNKSFKSKEILHGEIKMDNAIYYGMYYIVENRFIRNGYGTMTYNDGKIYECEWKDDKEVGNCIIMYRDGSVFEGMWDKFIRGNVGIMKYISGDVYEGGWKDDKRSCYGTMKYADSSVYEGEWKDDKKWRKGIMRYNDGSVYEGEWEDGERNGNGKMNYVSGDIYDGEWKNGERNGNGTIWYKKGSKYKGWWKDGERLKNV